MASVSVTAAREAFSDLVNRVAHTDERVELERHGKPVAAIVSIEDVRLLEALEDRLDVEAVEAALAASTNREAIPWKKVKARLGL